MLPKEIWQLSNVHTVFFLSTVEWMRASESPRRKLSMGIETIPTETQQHGRDSGESSKCRSREVESPSKIVYSLLNKITEIAKTAKFIFIV